jgi:hypothetical protein
MSKRVLLHVGTPKTGTSYLQDVLFHNRKLLAAHGVLYPADRFDAHFLAALDLMRLPWGGLETEAVGAWDALAAQIRDWKGTAIVSHEILAHASAAQIERALASFAPPGQQRAEVHVLISARDLVRQIPAEWQENVKHRRVISYGQFLDAIRDPARSTETGTWFWAVQELPDILQRWAGTLPASQVHVITVPKPGSPKTLLWERFVAAFGLGDIPLDRHEERSNPSLGVPEAALMRRINRAVNEVVPPADYRPLVRELLAHQTLSRRTDSPRLSVPDDVHAWASELAATWVAELRSRQYDVVGDLDELLADPEPLPFVDPDNPRERLVNNAALDAIKALLLENARLRHSEEELHGVIRDRDDQLRRAYLRPSYKLREKVVERLEGGRLLDAYRRARGRSSRSA